MGFWSSPRGLSLTHLHHTLASHSLHPQMLHHPLSLLSSFTPSFHSPLCVSVSVHSTPHSPLPTTFTRFMSFPFSAVHPSLYSGCHFLLQANHSSNAWRPTVSLLYSPLLVSRLSSTTPTPFSLFPTHFPVVVVASLYLLSIHHS